MNPHPRPTKRQIIRAALTRDPGREGDQVLWWGVKMIERLGFPIFVAFYLLTQLPATIAAHTRAIEELSRNLVAHLQVTTAPRFEPICPPPRVTP